MPTAVSDRYGNDDGARMTGSLTGKRDGFPGYEGYAMSRIIHSHDPRQTGYTLGSLFPTMEQASNPISHCLIRAGSYSAVNARNCSKAPAWGGATRAICVLIVCCVTMIGGCESSVQRGKFAANGTFGVKTNDGRFVEVNGSKAGTSDRKPLLRILTVFRNEPLQDDLSEAHREFESVIDFTGKNHELSVTWDRQADQVSVAGSSFDRSKVNLIACVYDGKSWSVFGGQHRSPRKKC